MRLARLAGGAILWTAILLGMVSAAVPVLADGGKVEYISVHSPALEGNLLKDSYV